VRPPRLGVGVRAVPRLCINYALAFTLQLRKITVKPQSGQQQRLALLPLLLYAFVVWCSGSVQPHIAGG
jgi:hypothetical protein